jgi:hypothetical protein
MVLPDTKHIRVSLDRDLIDGNNSLWIMNRDGLGMHKLLDDAAWSAWGPIPQVQPQKKTYLPAIRGAR